MDLRWWSGRDVPDEVEVGGTWLAASVQRTPLNTEAKLLLLGHAFEMWGVHRVALATDARNERSRAAIERIGARFEGVLRNHRFSYAPARTVGPATPRCSPSPPTTGPPCGQRWPIVSPEPAQAVCSAARISVVVAGA